MQERCAQEREGLSGEARCRPGVDFGLAASGAWSWLVSEGLSWCEQESFTAAQREFKEISERLHDAKEELEREGRRCSHKNVCFGCLAFRSLHARAPTPGAG